jgi:DNA-binding transcriptional LysR family regulator
MDLDELHAFLHVIKQGSFHGAANATGLSRTTLRRRIDALEERAGVALLESGRQGVVLTEPGHALAKRGQAIIEEASALVASIREVGKEPSGVLRVVMTAGMPPMLLAPLFSSLRSTYPRLRVHCRFCEEPLSESLIDTDMVVHFGEATPRGPWISLIVLRVQERLRANRSYLDNHGTPTSVDDLASHELLSWQGERDGNTHWPLLAGGTFPVQPALISTDVHLIRNFCGMGLGIALLPETFDGATLSLPSLEPILANVVGWERVVRITIPEALSDIPKVKMILTHIRRFLASFTASQSRPVF